MLRYDRSVPGHVRRAIEVARTQRGTSAPFQRAAGGKFRKGHTIRSRIPRATTPTAIESDYAKAMIDILRAGQKQLDALLAHLPALLAAARASRGDAYADEVHATERRTARSGLGIVVENPAGSVREWVDSNGERGQTTMKFDYGYIDGVRGVDGEEVDVYLGPVDDPSLVFVVHQQSKASGFAEYDEDKVMLGWDSADDALAAYVAQYDDPRFFGGMSVHGIDAFKQMLRDAGIELGPIEVGKLAHRADAAGDEARQARAMIDRARRAMAENMSVGRLESLAERYGRATSDHQRTQLRRQVRAALGIDLTTVDARVPALLGHFVQENVALITSLGNQSMDNVQSIVTRAFTSGARHEDVADEIRDRFGVSERRARLIARDQIGKINGQINAARQREIGVRRFTWRTVGDERVRDEHQALNGQVFSYDDPPEEGLPGEPINCRCSAEPVLDDIFDELAGPDEAAPDEAVQPTEPDDANIDEEADSPRARSFALFGGDDTTTEEDARAVTPKAGESAAAFSARMAKNEASRKSKALARAAAKARAGIPVITPTVTPTVAPIAATPSTPAPAAKPTPATLPSSAIAPAGPPAATLSPKAIAVVAKPGETPAQFAARMARNEASRISKARARAAKAGVAAQPAMPRPSAAPIVTPSSATPPATPAPASSKSRRTSSGPDWMPTPPAHLPDDVAKKIPKLEDISKMSRAELLAYSEAKRLGTNDPTSEFRWNAEISDRTPEQHAAMQALNEAIRKAEAAERKERAAAPLAFVDVPKSAPKMSSKVAKPAALALAPVAEGGTRVPAGGQKKVREHLRSVIDQYQFSRRDPLTGDGVKLKIRSNYRARGTHDSRGLITLGNDVARNGAKFVNRMATDGPDKFRDDLRAAKKLSASWSRPQGDQPSYATLSDQANDYRTYIHEQVHGYGPRGQFSGAYAREGVFTEEVTTEVSARKIVRDQAGLDHGDIEALSRPMHTGSAGSYTREIALAHVNTELAINEVTGVTLDKDQSYEVLERASMRFKSLDSHPDGDDPAGLTRLFARSYDFDDIERRTGKKLSDSDRQKLTDALARRMTSSAR